MSGPINKRAVDALKPGEVITDSIIRGFQARCLPSGRVRFTFRYRLPGGLRKDMPLGMHGELTVDQARDIAADHAHARRQGHDPAAKTKAAAARSTNTVNHVLDRYLDQRVRGRLRSVKTIESAFDRLVRPEIGSMPIYDVKKSHIAKMLDKAPGEVAADAYWRYLRAAFNWWAGRDDEFRTPKIEARIKPSEIARKRILSDEEVSDVWRALDAIDYGRGVPTSYARFVRALLLTGQRRSNVAQMHADEITADGWLIPAAKMKGKNAHLVYVTDALREQVGEGDGFLFSSDGGKSALGNFDEGKKALDAAIAAIRKRERRKPMPHWVLHDLRRTARSIVSRYATPDIAERVLGHVIPGVRGVYDHYEYADEKRDALVALATHIDGVVHPRPDGVVNFPSRRARPSAAPAQGG